jgi:hypothetical protein
MHASDAGGISARADGSGWQKGFCRCWIKEKLNRGLGSVGGGLAGNRSTPGFGLHRLDRSVVIIEAGDSGFVAFAALVAGSWALDRGGFIELDRYRQQ